MYDDRASRGEALADELYTLSEFPEPAPWLGMSPREPREETASERAARKRRDDAERQRRSRAFRRDREDARARDLAAREREVAEREAELEARANDTAIVDALRTVLMRAGTAGRLRTQEELKAARVSLYAILGEFLYAEVVDGGRDRSEAVRALHDRLIR